MRRLSVPALVQRERLGVTFRENWHEARQRDGSFPNAKMLRDHCWTPVLWNSNIDQALKRKS